MRISFIALGAMLAGAAPAMAETAQMTDAAIIPADVVITASMADKALHTLHSPALGIGINATQIAAVNMANAEDALRYAPALIVRKRYIGDANATLSLRNMHTQQTPRALVMVDGFTIANFLGAGFTTAPKWAVLAPDDVGRAEIIYGPTSARYSGHSMGGTVNLATRPIVKTGIWANAQIVGQNYRYYKSNENLYGWSIDTGLDLAFSDRGGMSISYRYFRNEGQPQEWRMAGAATAYGDQAIIDPELPFLRVGAQDSVVDGREDQIRMRAHYDFGGWRARTLAALWIDKEETLDPKSFLVDAAGRETFIGVSGITAGIAKSTQLLVGVGVSGTVAGWEVDLAVSRFDILGGKSRTSDNFDMETGARPVTGRIGENDAAWNSLEASARRQWGAHGIAAGLSYAGYSDDNRTLHSPDWAHGEIAALRDASGGRTRLIGIFVEDAIDLGPRLRATLGLRHEQWRASDGFLRNGGQTVSYPGRKHHVWSPKLALNFALDANTDITASAALATRFPTVGELYQAGLIGFGPHVGQLDLNGFDPDLKPERAIDLQLIAMRRFGNISLTVAGYRQDVKNSIFTQSIAIPDAVTGELAQNSLATNIDKVRTWGVDAIVAAENLLVDGLSLDANISWIDAEITRNILDPALVGNHFPRVPRWRFNASLRYSPDENWTLAAGIRHQGTPDRNIENNATSRCGTFYCVTDFSFVDTKISYRLGGITLSAGVDNILNEKAFVYHPYPGRTFLFGLKWDGRR